MNDIKILVATHKEAYVPQRQWSDKSNELCSSCNRL